MRLRPSCASCSRRMELFMFIAIRRCFHSCVAHSMTCSVLRHERRDLALREQTEVQLSKLLPRDWECVLVYARSIGNQTFHNQLVPVKEVQQQAVVAWEPIAKKRIAKRDENRAI